MRSGRLILVVEDDIGFRRELCAAIEDAGYPAVGASSGRDALDWLNSGAIRPGLIVLDLNMDEMNGEVFKARLAQDRRYQAIPVVLISARPDLDAVAARLQVQAALSKPFSPDALLDQIRELCA
jgi:CheY-like chemotaxis protein